MSIEQFTYRHTETRRTIYCPRSTSSHGSNNSIDIHSTLTLQYTQALSKRRDVTETLTPPYTTNVNLSYSCPPPLYKRVFGTRHILGVSVYQSLFYTWRTYPRKTYKVLICNLSCISAISYHMKHKLDPFPFGRGNIWHLDEHRLTGYYIQMEKVYTDQYNKPNEKEAHRIQANSKAVKQPTSLK